MLISDLFGSNFQELPMLAGVYYLYDQNNNLVYIGKSINIRKRIQQHFSSKDRKSLKIQTYVKSVKYEVTGSELIALLYESELIKQFQPLFNRAQRKTIYQYGLYLETINDYKALRIKRINQENQELTVFSNFNEAKNTLFKITEKFKLCQKINGLYKSSSSCFQYHIHECNGACLNKENPTSYNQRVDEFISKTTLSYSSTLIELEGRNDSEIGIVSIQNSVYKGFGFCPINTENKIQYIMPKQDNKDIKRILIRYFMSQNKEVTIS